jgi:hypothetical protein
MGWYDQKKNIHEYMKMASGYDGRELINLLKKYLLEGLSVLELGMGPGKDIDFLKQYYKATGSDVSEIFLDFYRKKHPRADLLLLDAITIDTGRRFDGIYSNKVLIHLNKKELLKSFRKQREILNKDGIMLHTFWKGIGEEEINGLRFVYYSIDELLNIIGNKFKILYVDEYREIEASDSIVVILRK